MSHERTTVPEDDIFTVIHRIKNETDIELAKLEEERQRILRRHEIRVLGALARHRRAA